MHFRNSPTEWMGLNHTAEMLSCRIMQPPKSSGTRFISFRYRALEALKTNWAPLVFFYSNQVSSPSSAKSNADKARGFLRHLLNAQFMARCWAYMDILSVASVTCKAIQATKNMNIAHALTKLDRMRIEFDEMKECAGEHEQEILKMFLEAKPAEVEVHPSISTRRNQGNTSGEGESGGQKEVFLPMKKIQRSRKKKITGEIISPPPEETFLSTEAVVVKSCSAAINSIAIERSDAVTKIIDATAERFQEFEQNDHVLSHLTWLHVSSWPTASDRKPPENELKKIREFQQQDVEEFINHYIAPLKSVTFSKEKAMKQFKDLKMTRALSSALQHMESDDFWPYVYKTYKGDNKDFFLVVELALSLPFSEAVVESGFSAKGRILTDWRCSLSHHTITDLLHFSTRKGDLNYCNMNNKNKLIKAAAVKFVSGEDAEVQTTGLSTRRINKLCKLLEDDTDVDVVEIECDDVVEIECEEGEENSDIEMSEL